MLQEPEKFRNYYHCPYDGAEWQDTWSCMCNDRCPVCNLEIEPFESEELCIGCGTVVDDADDGKCPACGEPVKDFDGLQEKLVS